MINCSKRTYEPGSRTSLRIALDSRARRAQASFHNCVDPSTVHSKWMCNIILMRQSNSYHTFPHTKLQPLTTPCRQFLIYHFPRLRFSHSYQFLPTYLYKVNGRIGEISNRSNWTHEATTFNQSWIKAFRDSVSRTYKNICAYICEIYSGAAYVYMHIHTYTYVCA